MSIELYVWGTPNGRKISVALEEMGLPYSVHPVNIGKGDQFKPEFVKISPNSKIPAIIDREGPGGQPIHIFESGAILIYLGEKTGKFWPKGELGAPVPVLEWLMWQMGGFGPAPGQVHHFLQVEKAEDRRYGLERYMKETRRLYGVFDKRLGDVQFAAGNEVSIADFAILGWAWRHERHQVDLADCLVPFFKAGLDNNELGFWITSDPLNARDARRLLGNLQPDLADREASGQITIVDFADWYLGPTGSVTADALRESIERLAAAQQRGWAGVRMSGNSFWLERKYWALFSEYERKLEQVVRASKIVVLCSYSLQRCSVRDRAEILGHHDFAITRGATGWQIAKI